jgi:hypothetical protein
LSGAPRKKADEYMSDLTSFGGYTITTSADFEKDGIYGLAFCPICGREEQSHDHGHGEKYAVGISVGKVRTHMTRSHGIEEAGEEAESGPEKISESDSFQSN